MHNKKRMPSDIRRRMTNSRHRSNIDEGHSNPTRPNLPQHVVQARQHNSSYSSGYGVERHQRTRSGEPNCADHRATYSVTSTMTAAQSPSAPRRALHIVNPPSSTELGYGYDGGGDESTYDPEIYEEALRLDHSERRLSRLQEQEDAMLAVRLQEEEEERLQAEQDAARRRAEEEESSNILERDERERLVHQLLELYTQNSARPSARLIPLPRVTDKLIEYNATSDSASSCEDNACDTNSCGCCNKIMGSTLDHLHHCQDLEMLSTEDCSPSDVCAVCYEPLDTGVAVSLRVCSHLFHLECIYEALQHQKGCPTCRTNVRSTPRKGDSPSGTMFVSRPEIGAAVVDHPDAVNPTIIKIDYKIPDGYQSSHHAVPGKPYQGLRRVAFLPDTAQGNEIIHRLIYAFEHGLTFRVTPDEGKVRWGSIPHLSFLGEKAEDVIRLAECTEELDRLGIPDPRSLLQRQP